MSEDSAFDVQAVYRQTRKRYHALTDRIRALMQVEGRVQAEATSAREQSDALRRSVAIVETAGGDAASLKDQLAAIEPIAAQTAGQLAKLNEEMRLVRASLKWADMAHDGLHWLCFSEADLNRFDAAEQAA